MKEAGDLMSEQSTHIQFKNTNKWDTKQLVTMALMCAIATLFMFVQIPLLPAAPFLTYDPSFVPAMVVGFAYGAGPGAAVGALAIVIHALITGDWVGALMNLVAALLFILPAAILYKKMHTYKGAIIGDSGRRTRNARLHRGEPHHWRVVLVRFCRRDFATHDSRW